MARVSGLMAQNMATSDRGSPFLRRGCEQSNLCGTLLSAVSAEFPGSESFSHYDPLKPSSEVNLKSMRLIVCLHMSKVICQLHVWAYQEGAILLGQTEGLGSAVEKTEECSPVHVARPGERRQSPISLLALLFHAGTPYPATFSK